MFWSWMRHGLAAGVISGVGCWASAADALSLRLIGSYEIPTGTMFEGAEFGGISAIDLGPDGVFYALSDDRGGEGRTPRFYMIDLDYDGGGFHDVKIAGVRHMRDLGGEHFPSDRRSVDPEGLRVAPNGNLYWSSEGNFSDAADEFVQPFLREMTPEGEYVRDLAVPGLFNYFDNATAGARSNKVFEALAVEESGAIWIVNEDAIFEDGPAASLKAGSLVRFTRFDAETGRADGQFVYALPAIPLDAKEGAPFAPDNGVAELLALPGGGMLALERAFAWGHGNTIRLVSTGILNSATDVTGEQSLVDLELSMMPRDVVLEMGPEFEGVTLDNMEAMSWGPDLPNGNRSLVLVSDNNFNDSQRTLFMAFEVTGLAED